MLRTPKSQVRTGRGVKVGDALRVYRGAFDYFVRSEDDYDADRLAKVAVRQLRRATHIESDTTFILSRANLETIAIVRALR